MIALRLLSLLAGFLVLIFPAAMLADASLTGLPGVTVFAGLTGLALVSASFVYVGIAGARMRRHRRERALGGTLLAVPIMGSLFLLASHNDADMLWASDIVLVFSLVLFMSFVFRAGERRQRPMRRRERQEPVLLKLQ
jgi:hypothetical protein